MYTRIKTTHLDNFDLIVIFCVFIPLISVCDGKRWKNLFQRQKMISTSKRRAEHLFTGQNTQHTLSRGRERERERERERLPKFKKISELKLIFEILGRGIEDFSRGQQNFL